MKHGWEKDGFDSFEDFAEDGAPFESKKVWELSAFEREQLVQTYGKQPESEQGPKCPRPVQEIRTLTAREKAVFEGQALVSPQYCIQILYKIRGEIDRNEFKKAVNQMLAENEELRVQYFPLGWHEKICKLVFQNTALDIRYQNMEKISDESIDRFLKKLMEDDREKGFDMAKEPLLRLTLIKTPRKTSAVLLTQSRLTAGRWNAHKLFADALDLVMVGRKKPEAWPEPPKDIPQVVNSYWHSLLKKLPGVPDLPGYMGSLRRYKKLIHTVTLPDNLMKLLQEKSNGNRRMMIAILQTAWGLFLQQVNFRLDTYYCLIMPDSISRLENADFTGHILHPMPVRLTCEENNTLKDIVGGQFRQMITSQTFSCSQMRELLEPLGDAEDMFPFCLNFQNFLIDNKTYSDAPSASDGQVVAVSSWDAGKTDFVMYFTMEQGTVNISYEGNAFCFEANAIELLTRSYEKSLQALLELWEEKQYLYARKLQQILSGEKSSKMEQHVHVQENMNMFSCIPGFSSLPKGCAKKLATEANLKVYFSGDEISEQEQKENLIFLIRGRVEHSLSFGGSESFKAVSDNAKWLNENILIDGFRYTEGLKVLSEQAQVLMVPLFKAQSYKELMSQLLTYALRRLWKYRQACFYKTPV